MAPERSGLDSSTDAVGRDDGRRTVRTGRLPVPDHIAVARPEPQTFTTPWGPVIRCGSDLLWFQDEREWVEHPGRDLPESFRLQASGPGPTPPPEPPPAPRPSGLPVGWLVARAVGLGGARRPRRMDRAARRPEGARADENVVVATSTTSGAASTTQAPTTSMTIYGPGSTVATGPRIPAEVAGAGRDGPRPPVRCPRRSRARHGGPALAVREPATGRRRSGLWSPTARSGSGTATSSSTTLDREITDPGVESAGTQLTVGRSPEVNEPSGLAGFADGYTERFFLGADGELTVLGDDGEAPPAPTPRTTSTR